MPKRGYIRKITKKGDYSYLVILPKRLIDDLNWRERQKVVIKKHGQDKLLISDWPVKKRK